MVEFKGKKKGLGAEWLLLPIILILDIFTKYLSSSKLKEGGKPFTLIKNFILFDYTINYNAAFSKNFGMDKFLSANQMRYAFIGIIILAVSCFIVMLILSRQSKPILRISLAMIIGGALGNVYDRIFFKGVRDFIRVDYFGKKLFGTYSFPTFNVADSFIVVGIALFLVYILFFYSKDAKNASDKKQTKKNKDIV